MPTLAQALRHLKRDRANEWDARTAGGAPHKPLVLLALCDVFEAGALCGSLVPFDGPPALRIGDRFQVYWRTLFPDRPGNLLLPLWHLQSDGFWFLRVRKGQRALESRPRGFAQLRERYEGARLSEELARRLQDASLREELRALLLGTYFDEPTRAVLARQIEWSREADLYSAKLLELGGASLLKERADVEALAVRQPEPVRSQGFRIAVLEAYVHRCAACGLRVRTPDGWTAAQAAHIRPWSLFHDDRIANGLCLCATCHWCFDGGLWSVPGEHIRVSRVLRWERNIPAHLETLDQRKLVVPDETRLRPDAECLAWHNRNRFRPS